MNLSTIERTVYKRKKRRGRGVGSGSGAKSGRGTTRHQTAREKIPLHFEGGQNRMVKRFPLLRGKSKNKSVQNKALTISLDILETFEKDSVIDMKALIEKKVIKNVKDQRVKVVATGTLTKSLTIALPVSGSAQKIIEKAGGKVQ